jgi:MoaA/NifB/PqqE/SkfB family radical SAM enzyme
MPEPQQHQEATEAPPRFRLDVQLHELLMQPAAKPAAPPAEKKEPQKLPEPVFPCRPELQKGADEDYIDADGKRHWTVPQIMHALHGWALPYVKSRLLPGAFHPIIAYLFTEWKCNLDCHYCWAFENSVKGMTEDIAKRSIDWLLSTTCRVLALMGGEPLLRPDFAHKVIYYAAKKGFWIYLPTNGRLMRPDVIDRLGDAGVSVVNLAIDAVDLKPGLPKALVPIRPYFEYLIRKQCRYGYNIFLNINICGNNMDDVRELTEIAHDNGVATDYHICESPMTEQPHFKHLEENPTFITPRHYDQVDELLDWLIAKQNAGYKMTNSTSRLAEMKQFMRGQLQSWNCRAGQNTCIIRTDGTLAPCFPMYSATYDWGTIENEKFDVKQLDTMKKSCQPHCFSTLNHIVAFCYNDARVIKWLFKQAMNGFQGVTNWSDD